MKPKEAFHVIKIKKELCKKCGKMIADSLMAARLGILSRSSYCSLSDHCADCADDLMKSAAKKSFRFLVGSVITKIEVGRFDLERITLCKGDRKVIIQAGGSYGLRVEAVKKKKG
jgi:hypothetical protein